MQYRCLCSVVLAVALASVSMTRPAQANNLQTGGMVISYLPKDNLLVLSTFERIESYLGTVYRFDTSRLSKDELAKIAKPGYGVSVRFHREKRGDVANLIVADSSE